MADKASSYQTIVETITKGNTLLFQFKLNECLEFWKSKKGEAHYCAAMYGMAQLIQSNQTDDKGVRSGCSSFLTEVLEALSKQCHMPLGALDDIFSSSKRPTALQMQQNPIAPLIAVCLSMKAGIHGIQENYLKAAMNLRKCWKYYEECYKIIEDYKGDDLDEDFVCDTLFGAGVFFFIMSLIPPAFTFFVEIIGFQGDRKKGWQILNRCSKRKSFVGLLSSLLIQSIHQFYFLDFEAGIKEYENCRKIFPEATISLWFGGMALRQMGRIKEADECFVTMIAAARDMKQAHCTLHYELASTALKSGDWNKAIKNLEFYVTETKTPGWLCIGCFELGMAYAEIDDNENAKKYFKMCMEKQRKDMPYEVYAGRKSKELLKKGVSNFDKITYAAKERTRVSGHDVAAKLLEKISESDLNTPEVRGVYYWIYGSCLRKIGNTDKAEQLLNLGLKEKVKIETFVIPFCMVELAEIEIARNGKDQAKKLLQQAKNSFKDYDFQTELHQRIARLTDNLNGVDYKMV